MMPDLSAKTVEATLKRRFRPVGQMAPRGMGAPPG